MPAKSISGVRHPEIQAFVPIFQAWIRIFQDWILFSKLGKLEIAFLSWETWIYIFQVGKTEFKEIQDGKSKFPTLDLHFPKFGKLEIYFFQV